MISNHNEESIGIQNVKQTVKTSICNALYFAMQHHPSLDLPWKTPEICS